MYQQLLRKINFPIYFVVIITLIQLIQSIFGLDFGQLGVFPRHLEGLPAILTAPLIHGSWEHWFYNSVSLLLLGAVLFGFYPRIALRSFIWIYLLSGLGVWIFAQPFTYHIGASGIVYGMVSLVFWNGIFRRNVKSIVLALIVLVMYGGFFPGIVPGKPGISWESHLLGAFAGIFLAWWYRNEIEEDEVPPPPLDEEEEVKEYYLPRDTFDMTMEERRILRAAPKSPEGDFL
ncbi:MAG TPA: rhomboid family intramembrane serine protease [Saprospiraceae bacterium]|nr:rhomboid family intramembrane serine protease [Saprospiraceae bacterium]